MLNYVHQPVLLKQVLAVMEPRARGMYVDATVGGGGHAWAVLKASSPDGRLFGCDRDGAAIEAAAERLAEFGGRFELRRGTYDQLEAWLGLARADAILLDLGVSSPQLDCPERGFSFQREGPLDMRMDPTQPLTAAALVNRAPVADLARWFGELGGERHARRIARMIDQERRKAPLTSTRQLAEVVERAVPWAGRRTHPATRVFQALRMKVNDELEGLRRGLATTLRVLKPGGRLLVITFHSAEDREVKRFGREHARGYRVPGELDVPELREPCPPELRILTRRAIHPSGEEMTANPRARSAQLRAMEKL